MIYLASPYSHPDRAIRRQRFEETRRETNLLLAEGKLVFSPIVYGHQFGEVFAMGTDALTWLAFNRSMLIRCDALLILQLPGWVGSTGIMWERQWAKELNLPIDYKEPRDGNLQHI